VRGEVSTGTGYPDDPDGENNDKGPDPDEAPETPLDEPPPPHLEEPAPPQPKGPYVVVGYGSGPTVSTEDETVNTGERKERRGFASMSPEKQREIASKGGRAAHEKGTAHEWTADEARSAGRKGGQVSRGGRGRLVEPSTPPAEGTPTPRPEENIQ
jgi:general stress protein YciG